MAAQEADIEEQTSDREREALAIAASQARAHLESAELAQDRRLFERQLEVVQGREETIEKAKGCSSASGCGATWPSTS
jgi:hypothetical protein